jgi:hypothetical protein
MAEHMHKKVRVGNMLLGSEEKVPFSWIIYAFKVIQT